MFHAGACRVFRTFFFTHRHPASTNPAHPVSVPIHPIDEKSSAVTSSETDIYIYIANTRYQVHTYTYGVYSCVWRLGCFPGAWRRGSWHFQVASLHLQSSMDLFLSASHYFSFLSKRSGRRMRGAKRLVSTCCNAVPQVPQAQLPQAQHSTARSARTKPQSTCPSEFVENASKPTEMARASTYRRAFKGRS